MRYFDAPPRDRSTPLDTLAIHAGEPRPRVEGAVSLPIFRSSTYELADDSAEVRYLRLNNTPGHTVLAEKLAALEATETATVTSSGMAAISATMIGLLTPGDHILVQACLYGGTLRLLERLARLGISHTAIDVHAPSTWSAALRTTSRMLYCESISNPLMEIGDLAAMSSFARQHGLVSAIDNTFATPFNLRPARLDFDLILHSASKYLGGHSDLLAGTVCGRAEHLEPIRDALQSLGGTLDPQACFLLHRSLKTLGVRMRQHNDASPRVAEALRAHRGVARVHYAGLAGHRDHARARELLGGLGGMLSFELANAGAVTAFLQRLEMVVHAPSLGGTETLVSIPAKTSHAAMTSDARRSLGIGDGLVRLSVGLEDPDDIIADLRGALDSISQ